MLDTIQDLVVPSDDPEVVRTADALLPLFYEDLHRLARRERRRLPSDTLQTTALIHEAYLRLRGTAGFNDHSHFLRASALAMRHVLVNRARDRLAGKRGGGAAVLPLEEEMLPEGALQSDSRILEVNEALGQLATLNLRLARVVECRFFAGYSEAETAQALGVTDRTVRRDWTKARAWLLHALSLNAEADDTRPVAVQPAATPS
ncbi:ECF-type sigma factor [Nitrospirillum sp. BR 11828]|uniref:ECF-type sigma factor n=1 Tax=Nitrospirillum sp. BR 11828 TaxID=3104325 RepID=UPI002ACAF020|nr:ECF-type sigma factor [Nitrospirillum sp. BR 11828]MDZ5648298.1 ECF-type sigma factor [Nitrospirillum sp. BR 11828]